MERRPTAGSRRTKRILQERAPKLIENAKKVMLMKGTKGSQWVNAALSDMTMITKPLSVLYSQKHRADPFEDDEIIRRYCKKSDAGLFVFGRHKRSRPNILVLGRMFNGEILDMLETQMTFFQAMSDLKTRKCSLGARPLILFNGEGFEQAPELMKLKSLLLDMLRGEKMPELELQGIDCVISVTAVDKNIYLRTYTAKMKKSGTRLPRMELDPMGPNMDLVIKRTRFASEDVQRAAMKHPKLDPKKTKNIERDGMGDLVGRIHTGTQDFGKLTTRKVKALKERREPNDHSEEGSEEGAEASEEQAESEEE